MDFFLAIYISFYFQLITFYYSENRELVKMKEIRSIESRIKGMFSIEISPEQVKYFFKKIRFYKDI